MREWAAEVTVDRTLARALIAAQFPDLELRMIRPLGHGWDTTVWLVDERWVFRFPRRELVIRGLLSEISELPRLASRLPLPIPTPTFIGAPSAAYRWPFSGAPFLPGRELADAGLGDAERIALGRPLGRFLRSLHATRLDADLPLDPASTRALVRLSVAPLCARPRPRGGRSCRDRTPRRAPGTLRRDHS